MRAIAKDNTVTQLVQFEVTPDQQDWLIAAIAGEAERWIRHRHGFVSSTLHASLDGRHVVNHAQWRSKADFRVFTADPETERLRAAIRAAGPADRPQPVACRVVRSIVPAKGPDL